MFGTFCNGALKGKRGAGISSHSDFTVKGLFHRQPKQRCEMQIA